MTEAQARAAYQAKFDVLADEDWADIAKDVTDWDAFVVNLETEDAEAKAKAEAEAKAKAEADAQAQADAAAAEAKAKAEAGEESAEDRVARLETDLAARNAELAEAVASRQTAETELAASQAQAREATLRGEIAATQFGDGLPTPTSVEMLLPVRMNPTAENAQALYDFLRENGGMLPTYIPGEGIGASATGADGNDGDAWLEAKPISDRGKTRTREIAATNGGDFKAAYREYCIELNQGK